MRSSVVKETNSLSLHKIFLMAEDINRLKLILVEKKKTSKWLADELGVNPSTVSKWCTNSSQPDLATVLKITDLLKIDIKELIVREYDTFLREKMKKK